jgi:hypothetical protein
VKALQYDLLHNVGKSTGNDGNAGVRVLDFNRGRVATVTGVVDQGLAGCISDILDDPNFPSLPKADDPNQAAHSATRARWSVAASGAAIGAFLFVLSLQVVNQQGQ